MCLPNSLFVILPNGDMFFFEGVRTLPKCGGEEAEMQFSVNGEWQPLAWFGEHEKAQAVKRDIAALIESGGCNVYRLPQNEMEHPIWLR